MLRNINIENSAPHVYMREPAPHHVDREAYCQIVANAILTTLGHMGIALDRVVFSGYRLSQPKEDSFEADLSMYSEVHDNLRLHMKEMAEREQDGVYLRDRSLKECDVGQLKELRQIAKSDVRPTYFFGTAENLTSTDEGVNPIVCAEEYPGDSVIGVYDVEALRQLGLIERPTECEVTAHPEEVEAAKILEFFLRFADPDIYN